ncbi:MAG: DUF6638 family protein [Bacteroidota bacterium]
MKRLIETGLMFGNLVPVRSPALVARYNRALRHLADRETQLTDFHILAVDQRGHGRSGGEPVTMWHVFGEDLESFVRQLDLTNIVGVGHSMGGYATIDASSRLQDRFRRIIANTRPNWAGAKACRANGSACCPESFTPNPGRFCVIRMIDT